MLQQVNREGRVRGIYAGGPRSLRDYGHLENYLRHGVRDLDAWRSESFKARGYGGTGKSVACTVRRQEEIKRWLGVGDHDLVSADREVKAWKCKDFVVR